MKYILPIMLFLPLYAQSLDGRYHTTEEIYSYLDSLDQLEELEGWFHLDTIGFSTQENIPILAVRISDNAHLKEDEPRVLFVGQVHAEEILGVEIVLDLINDLLFPDASIYTHMSILKQYLDIWIIPTANPEGLNVVHEELDLSYRKNKRDLSPDGPFPNGLFDYDPSIGNDIDGVDLNRNFSFNWTFGDTFLEPDNSDYASHYDYYKGEEPFSEGEAIAIRDLALDNDFVFSIVWHSSRSGNLSEKVFTSWKWEEVKESPDLAIMKSIADHFAGSISTEDGTSTYLSVYSGSRNGKLHDWFYRETGSIQYLVECGTSNLQPDSSLIEDTIDRNKPAMIYLMDRAIGYYTDAAQITGNVLDASTGEPIKDVNVEVVEHSGSVLKPRLTNEFGRYRRILDVGTYTFSFRAKGYLDQEISLVANNSAITEHDVYLEVAPTHQLNIRLVHETFDNNTVSGTISNEFETNEIQISTGDNIINLTEGYYDIRFFMDGSFMPWERSIHVSSDQEVSVPYQTGSVYDLSDSWPWPNFEGSWYMDHLGTLRSQEGQMYDNGDSLFSTLWMESELIDVSGMNRVVLSVLHRYETEWDHDRATISLLDENNIVLGSMSWTGDQWMELRPDLITATSEDGFTYVKVRLEFAPDQTVNYRGWELYTLDLFSTFDNYLDVQTSTTNNVPKIPMKINGIYPNPSFGRIQVNVGHYPGGSAKVNVYNILGQNIFSKIINNRPNGKQIIDLDLAHVDGLMTSTGMYFIKIQTQKEQAVKKCIILKN